LRGRGDDGEPGHLQPRLLRLARVAGGGEHGPQLAALVAVDGGVVGDLGERTGDVAQHQWVGAEKTLLEDPLVGRPRLLGFSEAVREVSADQAVTGAASGLLGSHVDVADLAPRVRDDQRVEAHLNEAVRVTGGLVCAHVRPR